MTATIYIWRRAKADINAHDTALLHPYEDAQPALYDLPTGWEVAKNQAGDDMIFDQNGRGQSLYVHGTGVAAISAAGIVWLKKAGSRQGQALKEAREDAGMSMRQLADVAGVSANTISLIEAGKSAPRADILASLAHALDMPMDAIWQ